METLTVKQKEFFENLIGCCERRALPSYEKIKELLGYKSKNSIRQYLSILKQRNLIVSIDNKLYINPEYFGAKLVSSYVRAGFASIMDDKIEKRISFDEILNIQASSTFVFKVSGDSMSDIGIYDGDYVVIKKTPEANIDDIVLAIVDNEFTLKTYKKDAKGAYLKPENKNYLIIRPRNSLSIFGVVLGIVRKIS